jgi:hypothetical protein
MRRVWLGVDSQVDNMPGRWVWTIRDGGSNGPVLARSVQTFPTEHDARAESWAVYHALRRSEGDRKKWGHL